MFLLTLFYLLIPFGFTVVLYVLGARSKVILAAPAVAFILLPVLLVAALYLFRSPIQQGRVMPGLGPVLNLVFPAPDLYIPLAVVPLKPGKNEYELQWSHKYVGRHALAVSVPGKAKSMSAMEPRLVVDMKAFDGEEFVFGGGTGKASHYWGKETYGQHLVWYRVPRDMTAGRPLKGVVTLIDGDLNLFLEKHPEATLKIVKVSDE